jgi:hypothetical protein
MTTNFTTDGTLGDDNINEYVMCNFIQAICN